MLLAFYRLLKGTELSMLICSESP